MIKIPVTKDITKIKSTYKMIGFTIAGAAVGIGIYLLLNKLVGMEIAVAIGLIVAVPICLPGWIAPYKIPLEKYAIKYFRDNYMVPKKLYYKRSLTKKDMTYQNKFTCDASEKEIERYLKKHKEYKGYK